MAGDTPDFVLRAHRPMRTRLLFAAGGMLLVLVSYGFFELGRYRGGYDLIAYSAERDRLVAETRRLTSENRALERQVAQLQTDLSVDQQAYEQIEARLTELQARIQEQEEDLAFYKGIISPEDGAAGLKVQEMTVRATGEARAYRMRLVLVQAKRHDRRVSGVVNFSVDGNQAGVATTLRPEQLAPEPQNVSEIAFSFRYFQDLEQDLLLPEGFAPERIHIEVRPNGRSARTLRQTYEWPVGTG